MHEMSIVVNIFDIITRQLSNQFGKNSGKVDKIVLAVGKLSSVVPEALEFAFEVARQDTIFRDAILDIREIPVEINCKKCNVTSIIDNPLFLCPRCNSEDVTIEKGRELFIESIDVEGFEEA